jgi:hypothetical protein
LSSLTFDHEMASRRRTTSKEPRTNEFPVFFLVAAGYASISMTKLPVGPSRWLASSIALRLSRAKPPF